MKNVIDINKLYASDFEVPQKIYILVLEKT